MLASARGVHGYISWMMLVSTAQRVLAVRMRKHPSNVHEPVPARAFWARDRRGQGGALKLLAAGAHVEGALMPCWMRELVLHGERA